MELLLILTLAGISWVLRGAVHAGNKQRTERQKRRAQEIGDANWKRYLEDYEERRRTGKLERWEH
jgi:hypothetical protein